ncbi:CHAP domain-containing protein [Jeotgalicoccus sp. WY2]|uniref:CHAP domain-containing protein n=1 Tax=Jeotgalicoccus sp. WY2 TaxID=2708346 RepID=UPI00201FFA18|nr:CHAP domain-containing protein [Jeotgalicoccus sp. WY2]
MENNTYDQGECTYYVFDKVKEDGMIERTWNDAEYWADRAEDDGYVVNNVPEEGSLMQTDRGEIGHVAYIETVYEDGSFAVSEMNFLEAYEVSERTITTEEAADYKYIHPKVNKHAGRG